MNIPQSIIKVAKDFQIANKLDIFEIESLLLHDFIHATLGLGVTTKEEEIVESIELVLEQGDIYNADALELARSLPVEFRNLYKFGNI